MNNPPPRNPTLAHYTAQEELARLTVQRDALRAALVDAVSVIQTWHNMGIRVDEASGIWDIYWRNAPEMASIRAALGAP